MTVAKLGGQRVFRTVTIITNDEECHQCHSPEAAVNGLLVMDLALQSFDRRFFTGIGSTVALGAVMVVLTVAVLVWLLRRMVLGPLAEIVVSSQRIVEGDLESRASVSGEGEFPHLAWQVNRMTDHLAASLREVEVKRTELQTILDAIDDEVVVLDKSRRVVAANEAFRSKLPDGSAEPVGGLCGDHPGTQWPCGVDRPNSCPVARVFETARLEKGIVSYVESNGEDRVVEIHASPLVVVDDVVRQVVEVRRDISERRQMEAILAHSEHLASLGLMASGLSHEINNPLGAIAASVEGLLRRLPGDPDMRGETRERLEQVLSRMAGEVERCRTITNRLLRIARPSERLRNLVDVNHVIEDVVALLSHDIRHAGIEVQLELREGLPIFRGDETQIVQIIMNVGMNAVQAMGEKGGRLRISTLAEDQRIVITVEDSGSGISLEVQKRMFEPFFTTKPAGKGTGLGLFITHQIVTSLGGSIHVRSEPGVGTKVVIGLPNQHGER
jgi:signal transduction histidine kinase/HAMP domain-containing protein